jgi:hypothetical protein
MKSSVFSASPELELLVKERGEQSLKNYLLEIKGVATPDEEVIKVIEKLAETYIHPEAGKEAAEALRQNFSVSTGDHHGVLCHPFSLHTLLIQKALSRKPIVALTCAGVSLDNSSWPRALFWHQDNYFEKISLYNYKDRHMSVFSVPGASFDVLKEKYKNASMSQKKMLLLLEKIWHGKDSFRAQAAQLTYELSKEIGFPEAPIIFIDQESVVLELLLLYHLEKETHISKLLTDQKWLALFQEKFENIRGAFSKERGTFLFWYMNPDTKIRERLFYRAGAFTTATGISVTCTVEALREAIKADLLMPSMALTFIVLSFHHGLVTGGGFLQIHYLGALKKAWIALLTELGESIPPFLEKLPTNYMESDFGLFKTDGHLLTLGDFLLKFPERERRESLVLEALETPIEKAIDAMMHEYEKIVSHEASKNMPALRQQSN